MVIAYKIKIHNCSLSLGILEILILKKMKLYFFRELGNHKLIGSIAPEIGKLNQLRVL